MPNRFYTSKPSAFDNIYKGAKQASEFANSRREDARKKEIFDLQNKISTASNQPNFDPNSMPAMQRLGVLAPMKAANISTTATGLSKAKKMSFFDDANKANNILNNEDMPMTQRMGLVHKLATERRDKIKRYGGDTTDTDLIIQSIEGGNLVEAQQALGFAVKEGKNLGFIQQSKTELMETALNKERQKEKLKIEGENRKRANAQEDKFHDEERANAKQAVFGFNKRAGTIRDSFTKIDKLLAPKDRGRRDIASAITMLARLLSPGIVTKEDFQALTDTIEPAAVLFERWMDRGGESKEFAMQMQKFYDPTNPGLFDKDGFMRTVRNVASGEIPALLDTMKDARSRAVRSGMKENALATNFDKNSNVLALNKIMNDKPDPKQTREEDEAELAALNARAGGQ